MGKSATLRLADQRAIQSLVQECRDLGDDHSSWHGHWLRGLAGLMGADWACGGETTLRPDGGVCVASTVVWGWENGFDRAAFERILEAEGSDICVSPLIDAYFHRPDGPDGTGALRSDLVPDGDWYPTPYFERVQRAIGIDHSVVTFRAFPHMAGRVNGLCLTRGSDIRRDFDPRDRARVREANTAITSLLGGLLARFDEPCPTQLSPRVRQVLACLLEGDSDKQAAARLRISPHTVNQYIKTIFTHFDVTTRAELLARWIRRKWGRGEW